MKITTGQFLFIVCELYLFAGLWNIRLHYMSQDILTALWLAVLCLPLVFNNIGIRVGLRDRRIKG